MANQTLSMKRVSEPTFSGRNPFHTQLTTGFDKSSVSVNNQLPSIYILIWEHLLKFYITERLLVFLQSIKATLTRSTTIFTEVSIFYFEIFDHNSIKH